jgi:hypothetical protein
MVCSEGQPCTVSETPNTDYEFETVPGTMGLMPFSDPFDNNYLEDQEEYLEEQQDMMEDAEFD